MTNPNATPSVPHPSRWSEELLQSLRSAGLLDDLAWRDAFTAVPRHHFLPYFYGTAGDTWPGNRWRILDANSVGDDAWCRLAYRDQTWVMRLAGPHNEPGYPASSSIQPSLAARLLNELAVTDNSHILEIGTGTGYLTALLCHRVGASNVTSIDIDPELIDSAGKLLPELGYTPKLATADGHHGCPEHAPYDRVLGTAAVGRIPHSWIEQTRPGGRIVTPLRSAIAIIDVHDDHHATGRFLPIVVRVLALRTRPRPSPASSPVPPITSSSPIDQRSLYDDNFRFLLDVALPGINFDDQDPLGGLIVRHTDGSTAQISPAGQVQQHGPRRLCDDIAAIHQIWHTAGEPSPDRYRLTIEPSGHTIWLDDPHRSYHWNL